jgi:hypothetical protein
MSAGSLDSFGNGSAGGLPLVGAQAATVPRALHHAAGTGAAGHGHGLTRAQQAAIVGLVSQVETAVLHVATACTCAVKVWQQQVPVVQALHGALEDRGCLGGRAARPLSATSTGAEATGGAYAGTVPELSDVLSRAMRMSEHVDQVLRTAKLEHQRRRQLYGFIPASTAELAMQSRPASAALFEPTQAAPAAGPAPDVPVARWKPIEPLRDCGGVGVVRSSRRAKRVPAPPTLQPAEPSTALPEAPLLSPSWRREHAAPPRGPGPGDHSLSPPSLSRRQHGADGAPDRHATGQQLEELHDKERRLACAMEQLVKVGEQVCISTSCWCLTCH